MRELPSVHHLHGRHVPPALGRQDRVRPVRPGQPADAEERARQPDTEGIRGRHRVHPAVEQDAARQGGTAHRRAVAPQDPDRARQVTRAPGARCNGL